MERLTEEYTSFPTAEGVLSRFCASEGHPRDGDEGVMPSVAVRQTAVGQLDEMELELRALMFRVIAQGMPARAMKQ